MSGLVIGWVGDDAQKIDGIDVIAVGGLHLLCLPPDAATKPHDRMRHHIRCFEAGHDLLPVAPRVALPLAQALEMTHSGEADLTHQLAGITGHGQISLALHRTDAPPAKPATLRSRRDWHNARSARSHALRDTLDALISPLTCRAVVMGQGQVDAVQCHLLIPRDAAGLTIAQMRSHALHQCDAAYRLDITGLWPAYAFASAPSLQNARKAA